MLLIILTFFAAFSIELLGTYISVVGLSSFLGVDFVIMSLAVALDAGKLIVVTLLYKYWDKLPKLMRMYMLPAAIVTMVVTSAGAFGYLSAAFQKAILPTKTSNIQVVALQDEKNRLQLRKESIDKQIAQLPAESIRGRTKLMNQFRDEQTVVTKRLYEIDKQLPELQAKNIDVESHAGPILYVSQAFNISVEEAVKWLIFLIISVFDPLAVTLVLCGNFLIEVRKRVSNAGAEVTAVIEMTPIDPPPLDSEFENINSPTEQIIPPPLNVNDTEELSKFSKFLEKRADGVDNVTAYDEVYGVEDEHATDDDHHSFEHSEPVELEVNEIEHPIEIVNTPELELEPLEIVESIEDTPVEIVAEVPVVDEIVDEPKPTIKSEKALNKLVPSRSLDDLLKASEATTIEPIVEPTVELVVEPVVIPPAPVDFVSVLSSQSNLPGSEISFDDPVATARNSNARKLY